MRALPYTVVYSLPILFGVGLWLGGPWLWVVPLVIFVAVPLGDALLGHDVTEPTEGPHEAIYDVALHAWLPVQGIVLAAALWRFSQGVTPVEGVAMILSMGLVSAGGGINIAHELMHRTRRFDRALAEGLMALSSYTWFCVEHVLGHHRNVATRTDPAFSRMGQTLYGFLPQTIGGGARSAWQLEGARCRRRGIPTFSLSNRRLRYALGLAALYGVIAATTGLAGVLFFAAQSLVSVVLLETINYVEHYGLEREQSADGSAVRVQPHHSWNSTFRFSNWFLFNLQRHSDHHAVASRPYDKLRACTDAPQLPLGYPTMVLMSLVPPLWFAVMNPRVVAQQQQAESAA
ncbi:MAG: alkane 1-monooxygenase [Myxococcales bacterium]|nr:alkane 1-monooxygenase [Myxococcales bacterium]